MGLQEVIINDSSPSVFTQNTPIAEDRGRAGSQILNSVCVRARVCVYGGVACSALRRCIIWSL